MATIMNKANRLRTALQSSSGLSFGAWQMLPGTHLSRAIARSGVDWVLIDCEHGNIADSDMHESVNAVASCGVSPIVRIPDNQGWMVKRALDSGAHGIIVPLLYTVDDARRLVESAKFPPRGRRGFGSPFSPGAFDVAGGLTGAQYLQSANDNLLTIVQIETKEALACVEGIAAVDGIDVLFVGPWDLGNNIGHPVSGDFAPELEQAISTILKAANKAGKRAGIYCPSGEAARKYADQGFHMISVMTDMVAVPAHFSQSLAQAKGSYMHAAMKGATGMVSGLVSGRGDKKDS